MDVAKLIARLQERRREHAEQRVASPAGPDFAFEYGRACGVNTGLRMAEEVINEILSEEQERDI